MKKIVEMNGKALAETPSWLDSVSQRERLIAESHSVGPFGFPAHRGEPTCFF
jgi:hypothetical protein